MPRPGAEQPSPLSPPTRPQAPAAGPAATRTRQQRRGVDRRLGDDLIGRPVRPRADHGQGPAKAVDDPVLGDAGLDVLLPLVLVIAAAVAAAGGHELDYDRGHVLPRVGPAAESGPGDARGR